MARAAVEQEPTLAERKLASFPFALTLLCEVLLRRGQLEAAHEEGQRALAAMTEEQDGHWYLGHLREVLGEIERQRQLAKEALPDLPVLESEQ